MQAVQNYQIRIFKVARTDSKLPPTACRYNAFRNYRRRLSFSGCEEGGILGWEIWENTEKFGHG